MVWMFSQARRARLPIALLTGCLAASSAAAAAETPVRDPIIEALAAGRSVPGLAVLVIQDGAVVHRAAYGTGESGPPGRPVDTHTPFYAASLAKMFTAAAVLILVEHGRLGLDDPIGNAVPETPSYAMGVTVQQLLTHTSGLPDFYDLGGEQRSWTTESVLDLLRQQTALEFEPGTRASYSNSGYVLLALLIEAVSGHSYADFLGRALFTPAGMADTFVVTAPGLRPPGHAIGYRRDGTDWSPLEYASAVPGPGGVYLSLADLEAWYRALSEGRILAPASLALASRPPDLPAGRLTPYGMGWLAEFAARGPLADRWYLLAYGSLGGYRAAWQWYREDDLLIAWLANGDDEELLGVFGGIAEQRLVGD